MGRASRTKKLRRAGLPVDAPARPPRSLYVDMLRHAESLRRGGEEEVGAQLQAKLAQARIVRVDAQQVRALPVTKESWMVLGDRLPFGVTLIDASDVEYKIDDLYRASSVLWEDEHAKPWNALDGTIILSGALLMDHSHESTMTPVIRRSDGALFPIGSMTVSHEEGGDVAFYASSPERFSRWLGEEDEQRIAKAAIATLMAPIASVLYFMRSANVEVVPSAPWPSGHKAGRRPHFDVVVRQRARRSAPSGHHVAIDWQHRWETIGHYKHHGPGTPIFSAAQRSQPDKIVNDPKHGPCVRIWCPAFVKGPEDKPLVPKRRIVR